MRLRSAGLRFLLAVGLAAIISIPGLLAIPSAESQSTTPVTVSIVRFWDSARLDQGLGAIDQGDYYGKVQIGNNSYQDTKPNTITPSGVGAPQEPFWTFTRNVNTSNSPVTIRIQILDHDPGTLAKDDDALDISPNDNDIILTLQLDLNTGTWTGDVPSSQPFAEGDGDQAHQNTGTNAGAAGTVFFDVSTLSNNGDLDGDGLLDGWEANGYHADTDGSVDVDLPGFGADPQRSDLFVEIDCLRSDGNQNGTFIDPHDHTHCPGQVAMNNVVQSFANAPVPNPDGTTGVQLHLDTGTHGAGGVIQVPGNNGVTGTFGDFGGGNQIDEDGNKVVVFNPSSSNPGTSFYALKQNNFDYFSRRLIFRYSLSVHQIGQNSCTSGRAEGIPGNDFMVSLGGQRDLDGDGTGDIPCWGTASASNAIDDDNDGTIDEDPVNGTDDDGDCAPGTDTDGDGNICDRGDIGVDEDGGFSVGRQDQQSGTFMHELGHAIGLRHGGGDNVNNKPNYLSVMSYAFQQCGVPSGPAGTGTPLPGNCDYSRDNLPTLNEPNPPGLDECQGVDGGLYGLGTVDFDGDGTVEGTSGCNPPNNSNVSVDVNNDNDTNDNHQGYDDWANIVYQFRTLGNFNDGTNNPVQNEPTPEIIEESQQFMRNLLAPDLSVSTTDSADPIVAGEQMTYTLTVTNNGSSQANQVQVVDTLPSGVSYVSDDAGCSLSSGTVTCNAGTLQPGGQTEIDITVQVNADLIANNGGTVTITNEATANQQAASFQDADSANNTGTEQTSIEAEADLAVSVTDAPDPAIAGEQIDYTLTITNDGPSAAAQVQVENTLPSGVSYVSDNAGCSNSSGTVTCGLGQMAAGSSQNLTITGLVDPNLVYTSNGQPTITNQVSVTDQAAFVENPTPGDNSTAVNTPIDAEADLAVTSVGAPNAPVEVLIGDPVTVSMETTIANNGPSGPVDLTVDAAASGDAGLNVTPATASQQITALSPGGQTTVTETITLACQEPGSHTASFSSSAALAKSVATDPNTGNNGQGTQMTVDCVVPAAINIVPGDSTNSLDSRSRREVIPVAVLSTVAGEYGLPVAIDATTVNVHTVRFGPRNLVFNTTSPGGAQDVTGRGEIGDSYEPNDLMRDGDPDMEFEFYQHETQLDGSDTEACLRGTFTTGGGGERSRRGAPNTGGPETFTFFGCDSIDMQP